MQEIQHHLLMIPLQKDRFRECPGEANQVVNDTGRVRAAIHIIPEENNLVLLRRAHLGYELFELVQITVDVAYRQQFHFSRSKSRTRSCSS